MNEKKTVAIACEGPSGLDGDVSDHFGHATHFVVAEVAGGEVLSARVVAAAPHGEGGPGAPALMAQLKANIVILGGLGPRAADMLSSLGIEVVGGVRGNAGEALRAWVAGTLGQGNSSCPGHAAGGHECGGHHHHHE